MRRRHMRCLMQPSGEVAIVGGGIAERTFENTQRSAEPLPLSEEDAWNWSRLSVLTHDETQQRIFHQRLSATTMWIDWA